MQYKLKARSGRNVIFDWDAGRAPTLEDVDAIDEQQNGPDFSDVQSGSSLGPVEEVPDFGNLIQYGDRDVKVPERPLVHEATIGTNSKIDPTYENDDPLSSLKKFFDTNAYSWDNVKGIPNDLRRSRIGQWVEPFLDQENFTAEDRADAIFNPDKEPNVFQKGINAEELRLANSNEELMDPGRPLGPDEAPSWLIDDTPEARARYRAIRDTAPLAAMKTVGGITNIAGLAGGPLSKTGGMIGKGLGAVGDLGDAVSVAQGAEQIYSARSPMEVGMGMFQVGMGGASRLAGGGRENILEAYRDPNVDSTNMLLAGPIAEDGIGRRALNTYHGLSGRSFKSNLEKGAHAAPSIGILDASKSGIDSTSKEFAHDLEDPYQSQVVMVPNKGTVDPEVEGGHLYTGDAYTPTHPRKDRGDIREFLLKPAHEDILNKYIEQAPPEASVESVIAALEENPPPELVLEQMRYAARPGGPIGGWANPDYAAKESGSVSTGYEELNSLNDLKTKGALLSKGDSEWGKTISLADENLPKLKEKLKALKQEGIALDQVNDDSYRSYSRRKQIELEAQDIRKAIDDQETKYATRTFFEAKPDRVVGMNEYEGYWGDDISPELHDLAEQKGMKYLGETHDTAIQQAEKNLHEGGDYNPGDKVRLANGVEAEFLSRKNGENYVRFKDSKGKIENRVINDSEIGGLVSRGEVKDTVRYHPETELDKWSSVLRTDKDPDALKAARSRLEYLSKKGGKVGEEAKAALDAENTRKSQSDKIARDHLATQLKPKQLELLNRLMDEEGYSYSDAYDKVFPGNGSNVEYNNDLFTAEENAAYGKLVDKGYSAEEAYDIVFKGYPEEKSNFDKTPEDLDAETGLTPEENKLYEKFFNEHESDEFTLDAYDKYRNENYPVDAAIELAKIDKANKVGNVYETPDAHMSFGEAPKFKPGSPEQKAYEAETIARVRAQDEIDAAKYGYDVDEFRGEGKYKGKSVDFKDLVGKDLTPVDEPTPNDIHNFIMTASKEELTNALGEFKANKLIKRRDAIKKYGTSPDSAKTFMEIEKNKLGDVGDVLEFPTDKHMSFGETPEDHDADARLYWEKLARLEGMDEADIPSNLRRLAENTALDNDTGEFSAAVEKLISERTGEPLRNNEYSKPKEPAVPYFKWLDGRKPSKKLQAQWESEMERYETPDMRMAFDAGDESYADFLNKEDSVSLPKSAKSLYDEAVEEIRSGKKKIDIGIKIPEKSKGNVHYTVDANGIPVKVSNQGAGNQTAPGVSRNAPGKAKPIRMPSNPVQATSAQAGPVLPPSSAPVSATAPVAPINPQTPNVPGNINPPPGNVPQTQTGGGGRNRPPNRGGIRRVQGPKPPKPPKQGPPKPPEPAGKFEQFADVMNVSRTTKTAYDLGAMRQLGYLISRKGAWKGLIKGISAIREGKAHEIDLEIRRNPKYDIAEKAGLAITTMDPNSPLHKFEEAAASKIANKWIPGVRASSRMQTTALNVARMEIFSNIVDSKRWSNNGKKALSEGDYKKIANYVNSFSGRGDLGKYNVNAPILGVGLFSPRMQKSHVDKIAYIIKSVPPEKMGKIDPRLRKEVFRDVGSKLAINASLLYLAYATGTATVETDHRSTDFLQAKIGKKRVDLWNGLRPWAVYMAINGNALMRNLDKATGATKKLDEMGVPYAKEVGKYIGKGDIKKEDKFYNLERTDNPYSVGPVELGGKFIRSKESPSFSLLHDKLAGKNVVGEKFGPGMVTEKFSPMSIEDAKELLDDGEIGNAVLWLTALTGLIDVSTYDSDFKKNRDKPKPAFESVYPKKFIKRNFPGYIGDVGPVQ